VVVVGLVVEAAVLDVVVSGVVIVAVAGVVVVIHVVVVAVNVGTDVVFVVFGEEQVKVDECCRIGGSVCLYGHYLEVQY
jgi:hypothetical protein